MKKILLLINTFTNKIVKIAANNGEKYTKELLDSSWQEVKRLFVLAYNKMMMVKFLLILIKTIFFQ